MPPLSSPSESRDAAPPRTWRAGTLVYTSAGLVTLFCWLLFGDFAWAMRDRSVGPLAQWYLTTLKVPNVVFGILFSSFPAVIGLFLGPVISVRSDRHRSRFGRRIPFLLITTPLASGGMIGLGLTPLLVAWLHGHGGSLFQNQAMLSLAGFTLFWTCFEVASIAGQAVFGGLINDVVPQAVLGRFYGFFRMVSLVDGILFNYWIIGRAPTHFTGILVVLGLFYGVAFLWVCLKIREGDYPPPPARDIPPSATAVRRTTQGIGLYLRESFSHPYYRAVFLLLALASLVFLPVNTFAIPYARSLGIGMDIYGEYLALTFAISLGLSFFLGWLADLFHPLRLALATLLAYALVAAWGARYAVTPRAFLIAWVLHGVLSGCYMTGAASLAQRLFPRGKFAQFASAAGIVAALAHMVLAPAVGLVIDHGGHTYRYTFAASGVLAIGALLAAIEVHRRFLKLGGPVHYQAPE